MDPGHWGGEVTPLLKGFPSILGAPPPWPPGAGEEHGGGGDQRADPGEDQAGGRAAAQPGGPRDAVQARPACPPAPRRRPLGAPPTRGPNRAVGGGDFAFFVAFFYKKI